jgi:hypothetical protein
MKVVLEHVSGIAINNLQRAKVEMNRVLDFRGSVTSVKAKGTRITVSLETVKIVKNLTQIPLG